VSDNETGQHGGTLGRKISVLAFGDTADEIELNALDEARLVFGPDIALEIIRDYEIRTVLPGGVLATTANGKRYHATVTVRELA
jgi:hypothetical protein